MIQSRDEYYGNTEERRQNQDCLVSGYIWFHSKGEVRTHNRNYYILFAYRYGAILS